MVDPNVFEAVGIDPEECTGLRVRLRLERMAMTPLRHRQIKTFFDDDVRFLAQY